MWMSVPPSPRTRAEMGGKVCCPLWPAVSLGHRKCPWPQRSLPMPAFLCLVTTTWSTHTLELTAEGQRCLKINSTGARRPPVKTGSGWLSLPTATPASPEHLLAHKYKVTEFESQQGRVSE